MWSVDTTLKLGVGQLQRRVCCFDASWGSAAAESGATALAASASLFDAHISIPGDKGVLRSAVQG